MAVSARRRVAARVRLFDRLAIAASDWPMGNPRLLCRRRAGLGARDHAVHAGLPRDVKAIEVNALGAVAEKIQNLEKLAAQIGSATNQWLEVQAQAEKTAAGAKQIADKMAAEVREFSEFMQKMNDSEKAALRLEVEKFRRGEAEWLQVLVRIFDHIFALHAAAARSGQPKLAEQIAQFSKRLPRHRAPHRPDAVCRRTGRSRSTPSATSLPTPRKSRRPTPSSPKPSARVTRFKAGCCVRPSSGCAKPARRAAPPALHSASDGIAGGGK